MRDWHRDVLSKADADGRLRVLPCMVGDTVFLSGHPYIVTPRIRAGVVTSVLLTNEGVTVNVALDSKKLETCKWGIHCFATQEEAEAALKGGRKDV